MIRFYIITNDIQKSICLRELQGLEADFFNNSIDNAVFWRVYDENDMCAAVSACAVRKTAFLNIHADTSRTSHTTLILMHAVHQAVVRYHPEEIMMSHCCGLEDTDMRKNMFFPIGSVWCRKTEKWRLKISDSVFDDSGMIINQGGLEKLPFGWFNTRDKGCGWIAAYNLFRINGQEHTMENCAHSLEQYGFSGKLLGERSLTLYRWLKKEGLPVRMKMCTEAECCRLMKQSKNGILLYFHSRGGHYTAYANTGSGKIHFLNAVYGKRNMIMDPESFFSEHILIPVTVLIYIA